MKKTVVWSLGIAVVLILVLIIGISFTNHKTRTSNVAQAKVLLKQAPTSDLDQLTAILQQYPNLQIPQTIPFAVTGVSANVSNAGDISSKAKQIEIYFINKPTKAVFEERVLTHTATVGDPNKVITLKNGTKAYYNQNAHSAILNWNENGYNYAISSIASSGGKLLAETTLESIANAMQ